MQSLGAALCDKKQAGRKEKHSDENTSKEWVGGINPQTWNQVDLVLLLNKVAVRSIKRHLLNNFGK